MVDSSLVVIKQRARVCGLSRSANNSRSFHARPRRGKRKEVSWDRRTMVKSNPHRIRIRKPCYLSPTRYPPTPPRTTKPFERSTNGRRHTDSDQARRQDLSLSDGPKNRTGRGSDRSDQTVLPPHTVEIDKDKTSVDLQVFVIQPS